MVVGSIALLAGSDTVVHPIFHLNMDIDDATQARALDDVQQPLAGVFSLAGTRVGADLHSWTTSTMAPG